MGEYSGRFVCPAGQTYSYPNDFVKRVVLRRKNSLFVGNPRGGRTAAILASLTSSCRRHDMDPHLYFMQLLVNLPSWPARDLDAWLSDRWKQTRIARCAALGISMPPSR